MSTATDSNRPTRITITGPLSIITTTLDSGGGWNSDDSATIVIDSTNHYLTHRLADEANGYDGVTVTVEEPTP